MFNPIKTLIAATLLTAAASLPLSAQTQEPMMTFHTQRYDMVGAENVFSIALGAIEDTYVDIDFGFGPVEYKIVRLISMSIPVRLMAQLSPDR